MATNGSRLEPHSAIISCAGTNSLKAIMSLTNYPHTIEFELSTFCSHRCVHCYITNRALGDRDSVFNSRDYCQQLLLALRDFPVERFVLTGGEPTLHPQLRVFLAHCHSYNIPALIFTNGVMGKSFWRRYGAFSSILRIELSLYGFSEDSYFRFTGNRAGFRNAMEFSLEAEKRKVPVKIKIPIVDALAGEAEEMMRWAAERQFQVVRYYISQIPRLYDPSLERIGPTQPNPRLPLAGAQVKLSQSACGAGFSTIRITPRGELKGCHLHSSQLRIEDPSKIALYVRRLQSDVSSIVDRGFLLCGNRG